MTIMALKMGARFARKGNLTFQFISSFFIYRAHAVEQPCYCSWVFALSDFFLLSYLHPFCRCLLRMFLNYLSTFWGSLHIYLSEQPSGNLFVYPEHAVEQPCYCLWVFALSDFFCIRILCLSKHPSGNLFIYHAHVEE